MFSTLTAPILRFFGTDRMVGGGGRFTTAGTGAPTVQEAQGIVSITRTGVGVYLITFGQSWKELTFVCSNAGTAACVFAETARSASAKTVTVTAYASGGAVATEQTGPVCNFLFVARL